MVFAGWLRHSQDLRVQSTAAACLANLTHQPALCIAATRRAALQRLAAVFMRVMEPPQESPGSEVCSFAGHAACQ